MRDYRHNNSFQTSRDFYINELKNKKTNFNSSIKSIDKLDNYIDKWLGYSYNFLAPFFEDEDFQISYSNNTQKDQIDQGFDDSLPSWIKSMIDLIISIYRFIFPNKIQKKLTKIRNRIFNKKASTKRQNSFRKRYQKHQQNSPPT
jgi:hypothetical protein